MTLVIQKPTGASLAIQKPTGQKLLITPTQPVPNDPNFAFNSLLLHGNGTNGSTTITDSSPTPKAVTPVGNAQISTALSKPGFGGSSIAFDGNGDFLNAGISQDFNFGSSSFTVELWVYVNTFKAGGGCGFLTSWIGVTNFGFYLGLFNTNKLSFAWSTGGTSGTIATISDSATFTTSQWVHCALVKNNSALTLYKNGTSVATGTVSGAGAIFWAPTVPFYVASNRDPLVGEAESLDGYIDDLRITKGVARYTANFTPPTAPFPDF